LVYVHVYKRPAVIFLFHSIYFRFFFASNHVNLEIKNATFDMVTLAFKTRDSAYGDYAHYFVAMTSLPKLSTITFVDKPKVSYTSMNPR
jgi:hypothetical protein